MRHDSAEIQTIRADDTESSAAKPLVIGFTEIPTAIAERELFGAAKHAGTMEPGHEGYFARADKGTLFLDEIGDVNPAVQPKLLRAVETGEIQILGAKKKTKVDVRLLAGTDVDLEHAVKTGQFKSSLLERLAAYPIQIPPLRARKDDIGRLFIHFLKNELRTVGEISKLDEPKPGKRPWLPASFATKIALYPLAGQRAAAQKRSNQNCDYQQGESRIPARR